MKRHSATFVLGISVVLFGVGNSVGGEPPAASRPHRPEASATCPVCGMKVVVFPAGSTAGRIRNGVAFLQECR